MMKIGNGIMSKEDADSLDLKALVGQAEDAVKEFLDICPLQEGSLVVIGASTSEICGYKIGSYSSEDVAKAIVDRIYPLFTKRGIEVAAQCCEHLNRALILERSSALKRGYEEVNVVPMPKAGGSMATYLYRAMKDPVAVEHIKADAGLDIGDTLIGMHLKEVAVPLRLKCNTIGEARVVAARTRCKCIGGVRASYNEKLS